MSKTTKSERIRQATVMSITEHNIVIEGLNSQIQRLEAELKLKEEIITQYINSDAKYFESLKELKDDYDKCKEYWESNTKTLHNTIDILKAQVAAFKLSNEGFEAENRQLKANQKKWYHIF